MCNSELDRWGQNKFTFKLSSLVVSKRSAPRKGTIAKPCAFCGSVKIVNPSKENEKCFCDRECQAEHKRWHNKSQEYKQKTNDPDSTWMQHVKTLRQKAEAQRFNALQAKRIQRLTCCICCGKAFVRKQANSKFCSAHCSREVPYWDTKKGVIWCQECGIEHYTTKFASNKKYCSRKCQNKHNARKRDAMIRNLTSLYIEPIGIELLHKKHRGKCCNCGCKTVLPDAVNKPEHATIDHIVPVAKGGWHVWSNVQLLCMACNSAKRDLIDDYTQLMLPVSPQGD